MATTNLSMLKHLNCSPVTVEEISVGLTVFGPSRVGNGVIQYRCKRLTSKSAHFVSLNKDWPWKINVEFNQPDFDLADFSQLGDALKAFSRMGELPTSEQHAVVDRACALGYAYRMSFTQAHWSDRGLEVFRELQSSAA